ncbi:hypothetical protein SMSP2_02274 [Limihaloglobus sulfuriphilus]|uniref:Alginate export domain-containing protein n=1 Tax=Limihaloglobus sulfuriphilus TaxID=1851148 RepID=A0A1Q2MGR4_9BACT|nr:hypothetical protein [Limihaloglobus sulfuriphilus]AQQ71895.1 hypothetical protein SMSP2_02274 [Limihaloglobus sulfuriphilus]
MNFKKLIILAGFVLSAAVFAADNTDPFELPEFFGKPQVHGFIEGRGGYRTQNDLYEKDISVMDTRLQLDIFTYNDWGDFKYKGDFWGDGVTEQGKYQTRELWFFTRPLDFLDVKLGRQVLTWGTGDLLFLNDLFPKDWQSFMIGRDTEYLKAPSDAAKFSFFSDIANLDLVYTPKFDSDNYITGDYISYWNGGLGRTAGRDAIVRADERESWFTDDEIAARLYRNINNYELALYGYWGYWKSPGGQTPAGRAYFPRLDVYGASVRGQLGEGIANAEIAYYRSADDTGGNDPLVNNSEMRYLLGYSQEIARDFNAGVQYYIEQLLEYDDYRRYLPPAAAATKRDEFRQVVTLRLTKLLMNQNLTLSMFTFYSPTDEDAYLRPNIHYKFTDNLAAEIGANVFFGNSQHTFFGQFEDNTSIYTAIRYSF